MTLLICLPLIVVTVGLLARRWFVATRQDIRSIESHRSSLHHLEHLAPGEGAGSPVGAGAASAHVKIVGQPGDRPGSAVRPLTWRRPDGRPAAARPAWHASRPDPARARYARALQEAEEHAPRDRPRILITDDAVAALAARPGPVGRAPSATVRSRPTRAEPEPDPVVLADPVVEAPDGGPSEPDPEPDRVIITDPEGSGRADAAPAAVPAGRRHHRSPRSPRTHRRAVRILASAAGLMVVAAGAGVAVEELHPGTSGHAAHRAGGPTRTASPAGPTPTSLPPSPPPTTPPTLTATSASATDALYTLPAGPVDVSLSTSGTCWVELRTGSPTGPISYEGTLQPGASQSFAASGGIWLRLGDPSGVQLRINGATVNLPGGASPYNVTVATA